jgi:uncharacterized protein YbcV (DUF1398 family)
MKPEWAQVMENCVRGSVAGEMTFPQVISQLAAIGVERYHADYSRQEITYYLEDGDSYVVPAPHDPRIVTATQFSSVSIEAAVRRSQRNEHSYTDFVRETMEAGCVGYFAQITGRRVLYFGRCGDIHVENFPSVPVNFTKYATR